MNPNLETMTSRQLLKLQSDVNAALAQRHTKDIDVAEAERDQLRTDLANLANKWAKVGAAFPAPVAAKRPVSARANGNGHSKEAKPRRGAPSKVAPKFKDQVGNVWSGRGKRPRWLTERIASGAVIEDFRIPA